MRSISAFLVLLSLLLLTDLTWGARKDAGDYWKSIMKEEPMPKAIAELVHGGPSSSEARGMDKFTKNFDIKPNLIIYHSHVKPAEAKPMIIEDSKAEEKKYFSQNRQQARPKGD